MKNIINKIKDMNKKQKIMLVSILLSVILLIVGVSYAYYSANVKEVNKTQTVIKTNELTIVYTGTQEINVEGIVPGDSFTKKFTVENTSNIPVTYNIYLEDITNEFNEDLVYTLKDKDGTVIEEEVLPSTNSEKTYLITDIEIDSNELKEYEMTIEFKFSDKDQNKLQGKNFKATLGIDANPVKIVKVVSDKLELDKLSSGETITKTFSVKNLSKETQTYDLKLSDVVSTYGDNLTYSLVKNGNEIVSDKTMPSSDEVILSSQTIDAKKTDEYEIIIKFDNTTAALEYMIAAENNEFSAKINIAYEETGIEQNVSERLSLDTIEKGNSLATNISVENTSNKIRTYSISLDDFISVYAEGLVYTVTKNGTKIIETTDLPTANEVMVENQEINAKTTDEYVITVTREEGIVKTISSKISSTNVTSGTTKTATLTIENKSSKNDTYNISLSDFVSNYASGLKYTITKNGTTVVSYQDMPTSDKVLFNNQTLSANGKDTYVISITKEVIKTYIFNNGVVSGYNLVEGSYDTKHNITISNLITYNSVQNSYLYCSNAIKNNYKYLKVKIKAIGNSNYNWARVRFGIRPITGSDGSTSYTDYFIPNDWIKMVEAATYTTNDSNYRTVSIDLSGVTNTQYYLYIHTAGIYFSISEIWLES